MFVVDSADKPEVESPFPGVGRKSLVWGERMLLTQIIMRQDSVVERHDHPYEQMGYCIQGAIELEVGDEKAICRAGSAWTIPAGASHAATGLENSILVEAFSPPRDDYKD
jgi:quercetin dioxygenase-like cupin family protein